jgi:hypothetical protein
VILGSLAACGRRIAPQGEEGDPGRQSRVLFAAANLCPLVHALHTAALLDAEPIGTRIPKKAQKKHFKYILELSLTQS